MQRNIDDLTFAEESKEEKAPEVSAATDALVDAIYCHDLNAAEMAIANQADVNATIFCGNNNFHIPAEIEKERKGTPLHLAIATLQFDMVKLLLEKNADPNTQTSWNQSSLEILLEGLSIRFVSADLGHKERYIPALFQRMHLNKSLSRPKTFSETDIGLAENILDLLLCYGLNPKPEFSQMFLESQKELEKGANFQSTIIKSREMLKFIPEMIKVRTEALLEAEKASWLKKKFASTLINALASSTYQIRAWKIDRRLGSEKTAAKQFTPGLVSSLKHVHIHTEQAATAIQTEKNTLLSKYRTEIEATFPSGQNPVPLTKIILEYAIDFAKDFNQEISKRRFAEKRSLHFWQHLPSPAPVLTEEIKHNKLESVKISAYLLFLVEYFRQNNGNHNGLATGDLLMLIAEYAVEPKQPTNISKQQASISSKIAEYQIKLDLTNKVIDNFVKEQQNILEAKLKGTSLAGTSPATLEDLKKHFQLNHNEPVLAKIAELEKNRNELLAVYFQENIKLALIRWGNPQNKTSAKPSQAKQLKAEAKLFGYECKDMKHDGNCFFHAVADQLALKQLKHLGADHETLRTKAITYIFDHQDEYKNYLDEHDGNINNYIAKNMDPGIWADHLIISALSRALNVNIAIVRSDSAAPTIFKQHAPVATLVVGNEVGLHYQSLLENPKIKKTKFLQAYLEAAPVDLAPVAVNRLRLG